MGTCNYVLLGLQRSEKTSRKIRVIQAYLAMNYTFQKPFLIPSKILIVAIITRSGVCIVFRSLFKHPVEYKSDNSNGMYPSVDLSALEGIPWQSHSNHSNKQCRISPEISSSSLPPLSEKEGTAASNLSFSLQAHSLNITTKYPSGCMGYVKLYVI